MQTSSKKHSWFRAHPTVYTNQYRPQDRDELETGSIARISASGLTARRPSRDQGAVLTIIKGHLAPSAAAAADGKAPGEVRRGSTDQRPPSPTASTSASSGGDRESTTSSSSLPSRLLRLSSWGLIRRIYPVAAAIASAGLSSASEAARARAAAIKEAAVCSVIKCSFEGLEAADVAVGGPEPPVIGAVPLSRRDRVA